MVFIKKYKSYIVKSVTPTSLSMLRSKPFQQVNTVISYFFFPEQFCSYKSQLDVHIYTYTNECFYIGLFLYRIP